MSIDPDTNVSAVRVAISDFLQEHVSQEGDIIIGSILVYEAISDTGGRKLRKITMSADGESALPPWAQDGMLQRALDHECWAEWVRDGDGEDEEDEYGFEAEDE